MTDFTNDCCVYITGLQRSFRRKTVIPENDQALAEVKVRLVDADQVQLLTLPPGSPQGFHGKNRRFPQSLVGFSCTKGLMIF